MENFNPKIAYATLNDYYTEYLTQPKNKSKIESFVRSYLNNIPDDIYIEASNGAASGLCEHGFFEGDLQKVLSVLKNQIDKD